MKKNTIKSSSNNDKQMEPEMRGSERRESLREGW